MSIRFKINVDPKVTEKNVTELVVQVQQKIGMDLLAGIVLMTPVDTGRAAGNWQVTLNAAASGVTDDLDPSRTSTISKGSEVIMGAPAFTGIYITNNLPYILRLEEGSSTQAPQGMVQTTVDRVAGAFR